MLRLGLFLSLSACVNGMVFPGEPDGIVEDGGVAGCVQASPAVLNFSSGVEDLPATADVTVSDPCGIPRDLVLVLDDPDGGFQAPETAEVPGVDPVTVSITFAPPEPTPGARYDAQLVFLLDDARVASVQLGAVVESAE